MAQPPTNRPLRRSLPAQRAVNHVLGAGKAQAGQSAGKTYPDDSGVVEDFLKLSGRVGSAMQSEVGEAADRGYRQDRPLQLVEGLTVDA